QELPLELAEAEPVAQHHQSGHVAGVDLLGRLVRRLGAEQGVDERRDRLLAVARRAEAEPVAHPGRADRKRRRPHRVGAAVPARFGKLAQANAQRVQLPLQITVVGGDPAVGLGHGTVTICTGSKAASGGSPAQTTGMLSTPSTRRRTTYWPFSTSGTV